MALYLDRRPGSANNGFVIQTPGFPDCRVSVAEVFQRREGEPLTVTLRIDGDREIYVAVRDELLPSGDAGDTRRDEPRRWTPE